MFQAESGRIRDTLFDHLAPRCSKNKGEDGAQYIFRPLRLEPHSVKVVPMLPDLEREKDHALCEDLERQKKGLRFWTPGSE